MSLPPWEVIDSTWLLRSAFMNIRRDHCGKRDGSRTRDYFALELKDFSVVVALTPARERREETGHAADAFLSLGTFLLVPDLTASRGHVFLARDVRVEAAPHPDEDEEIEVATVPLDRAAGYLEDAASLLALHLARAHLSVQ